MLQNNHMNPDMQPYRYQQDPVLKHTGSLIFWLLAVIVVLHVEGAFNEIERRTVSVAIIAMSVILVCIVRVRIARGLGTPGIILLATIISYLVIGFVVAIIQGIDLQTSDYTKIGSIICFLTVLGASALGGYSTMETHGIEITFVRILKLFIITCVFIIFTPILISYGLISERIYLRNTGLFINPNDAGIAGCFTVVMAVSFLQRGSHRLLAFIALFVGLIASLSTVSKTALIVLFIVVILFGLFGKQRLLLLFLLMLLIGLIAIFLEDILLLASVVDLGRIYVVVDYLMSINTSGLDISYSDDKLDILTGRGLLWEIGLNRVFESPIVGHGFAQGHHLEEAPAILGSERLGVHNMYLMMIIDAGIIPLFLYFLYLLTYFRLLSFVPASVARDTTAGWTIVLILTGSTSHHLFHMEMVAFVIGLSCATIQLSNAPPSSKNP